MVYGVPVLHFIVNYLTYSWLAMLIKMRTRVFAQDLHMTDLRVKLGDTRL